MNHDYLYWALHYFELAEHKKVDAHYSQWDRDLAELEKMMWRHIFLHVEDAQWEPSLEEKYNFLLSRLSVTDIDLWENDALLKLKSIFIGITSADLDVLDTNEFKDRAISKSMISDKKHCKNHAIKD